MRLAEGLLLPTGLAVIIVVAEIMTKTSGTARLAAPAVVLLALIGVALARPWREHRRPGGWVLLTGLAVYVAFLTPVLLSGEPTFAGFIKLDDTSTWMAMADHVLQSGHDLSGLAPSAYATTLRDVAGPEPVGALLPWAIGHELVGQDLAWVFQPYLAFLGAMLALSAWALVGPLVRSRPLRAVLVFIATQAALLYGYSLWGGVKEVAAAWLLALSVCCASAVLASEARLRSFLPLGAASFAMLGVLGYGGAVWLCATLLVVGVGSVRIWASRTTPARLAALLALAVALAVGLIRGAESFVSADAPLTGPVLGNLLGRLSPLQVFGIWPSGDFRLTSLHASAVAHFLIVLVIVGIAFGLAAAWQARCWSLVLYLTAGVIGVVVVSARGGPWVQGKAFATVSPAVLLVGLVGAGTLIDGRGSFPWEGRRFSGRLLSVRPLLGGAIGVGIAFGVLWSNALAYHHVTLAPYGQLVELERIGDRFAGQGPTLINESEPYATRHFLRNMQPESPADVSLPLVPRPPGNNPQIEGGYADLDAFQPSSLLAYRTIVMRTSPAASRPPAAYRLVYQGRWYQVWQRSRVISRPVVGSIPLGNLGYPSGVPRCSQVVELAREAGTGGLLAAAFRPNPVLASVPSPLASGKTARSFAIRSSAPYELWLAGSFSERLVTSVDRVTIGSTSEVLSEPGGWTPLGTIRLKAGLHTVMLDYAGHPLAPGSGGPGAATTAPLGMGPLALSQPSGNEQVIYVRPAQARSLCRKAWDWVEALGR